MNAKAYFAISALSLFAATSSFAAEGTQEYTDFNALSTKSRAEVVAQTQRAGNAVQYVGEASAAPLAASTLQRVRVVAEAREALRLGLIGPSEAVPAPTAVQIEQIRLAGERAVAERLAAAK
jgi:hypothetical protein